MASRLGDALNLAEHWFGPRDLSWTPLGFEFGDDGPSLWFPDNKRNIIIRLGRPAANDILFGCWQLAHECIHLLSPLVGSRATNLEEGLATYFQYAYLSERVDREINWQARFPTADRNYESAQTLVGELLAQAGGSEVTMAGLRELRAGEKSFSAITAPILRQKFSGLNSELAETLCAPFPGRA